MKCGKLTAKLRDAVQVRFYENGREIKRYKNIEIPDAVKELEFQDFKFDVPLTGAITWICDVCVPADGYSIVGGLPDVRPMSSPSSPVTLNRSGRVVQLAVEPVLILTW